ncbi:hypothetical protein KIH75_06300 [Bifidobacterium sp. 64T4]|uniref:hypothetical protein n=1 Tax=Bifidobacterium pongonis TaxID=2834432 RepID=UPI001C59FB29|nr:hypothetical protein [Bifidobacterium pongonis]MBW3094948.1 hypothetical protein [Bifidobacterium pongonis]
MNDDETQQIPVDETVREPDMDSPTEALPQSQPVYGGERYGNAGYGNAGYGNAYYGNAHDGGEVIRPSGVSKATVVFGVFVCIVGIVTMVCGLNLPMDAWWGGIDAQRFLVYVLGGIGGLLIAIAMVWAIVGAVRARTAGGADGTAGTGDAGEADSSAEQSPERQ